MLISYTVLTEWWCAYAPSPTRHRLCHRLGSSYSSVQYVHQPSAVELPRKEKVLVTENDLLVTRGATPDGSWDRSTSWTPWLHAPSCQGDILLWPTKLLSPVLGFRYHALAPGYMYSFLLFCQWDMVLCHTSSILLSCPCHILVLSLRRQLSC